MQKVGRLVNRPMIPKMGTDTIGIRTVDAIESLTSQQFEMLASEILSVVRRTIKRFMRRKEVSKNIVFH